MPLSEIRSPGTWREYYCTGNIDLWICTSTGVQKRSITNVHKYATCNSFTTRGFLVRVPHILKQ